jgi:hypothetical protein
MLLSGNYSFAIPLRVWEPPVTQQTNLAGFSNFSDVDGDKA